MQNAWFFSRIEAKGNLLNCKKKKLLRVIHVMSRACTRAPCALGLVCGEKKVGPVFIIYFFSPNSTSLLIPVYIQLKKVETLMGTCHLPRH